MARTAALEEKSYPCAPTPMKMHELGVPPQARKSFSNLATPSFGYFSLTNEANFIIRFYANIRSGQATSEEDMVKYIHELIPNTLSFNDINYFYEIIPLTSSYDSLRHLCNDIMSSFIYMQRM